MSLQPKPSDARGRRSEQELADFFDNAPLGLHWVGPDGIILGANRAELTLLGYSADEYVGHHIADFHADKHVIEDILGRLQAGEDVREYEARMRCKDGSIKHVLIDSNVLWENDRFIHTRCFTRDLTDHKAAEEALRESEKRYRRLVSLLPVAVYTCQAPSGLITFYNDHAAALWGRAPGAGDTDERFCGSLKLWRPDGTFLPHEETPMAVALREGLQFRNQEVVIERPDGTRITVRVNIDPVRDENGRVVGAINAFHDTTALKRAETALRHSERRFREMIEALPAAIYTTDAEGHLTHFNPAAAQLAGRTPELGTDQWCVTWKLYHPDGTPMPHAQCPMAVSLKEGRAVRGEEAILERPDGTRAWFRPYPTPLRDAEGRVVGGINMLVDITDGKRADEALRESEARKAAMLDTALDGIITIDHEGKVLEFNRAAERIFGYRSDEALGREMAELIIPPAMRERHRNGMARYLATGEGRLLNRRLELTAVRADGSEFPVELAITPITTNGRPIFTGYIRDISDQKRAENTRQKQGQRLQLLWEAAAVLLTAADPDAMLRQLFARIGPHLDVDVYFNYMVNDSGDALWLASLEGIPAETALTIARLEIGHAINGAAALHRQPVVISDIQRSDDPKVQLIKSSGIRAYASNPLMIEDRLLGTLCFASRTKDQFDAGEVDFLQTICHYVTVAYERLRLLNELKEADRRKDEFLVTLAHELRNPLAPIRNAVQVLGLKGPDDPELRWGRDVIGRQVEHLSRLIDDLLDISRITRNRLELRPQCAELTGIINGAVEASRPLIEQCGHELTVTLPPAAVHLKGDVVRLAQVFLNLLNNAAKYTERGGHIWLSAEREGSDVLVKVKDTGVGIPAEKLPRLFEMFFQVDRSLEKSHGGLGVGLSLVQRLVELHGGTVEARSEGVGKGSEFTVRLPVLAEEPDRPISQEPGRNGEARAPTARRMLVVDDNRDSAETLAMLLRLTGDEVQVAYDGLEAVEVAEQLRPDVVVMDIGMPKLNGYDACRRLREAPWGQDLLLIALTGWGQEEDKRRAEEAGFDAHVVKPVDPTALMKLLASRS